MESKFLDARTKDNKLRLTAFSDNISTLVSNFSDWIADNYIPNWMIWYADIFNCNTLECLGSLELSDDGKIVMSPPSIAVIPFKRKRPFKYLLGLYK